MRYDPDALPFWEVERGSGPITERRRSHKISKEMIRVENEIKQAEHIARSDVPYVAWDMYGMSAPAYLRIMYEKRRELYRAVGRERYAPVGLYDYDASDKSHSRPTNPGRDSQLSYPYGEQKAAVRVIGYDGNGNRRIGPMSKSSGRSW